MSENSLRLTSRRSVKLAKTPAIQKKSSVVRTAPAPVTTAVSIPVENLEFWFEDWLSEAEIAQLSWSTIDARRWAAKRLLSFLDKIDAKYCGERELKKFFAFLRNPQNNRNYRPGRARPLSPNTIATYYERLLNFFGWLVRNGLIDVSPMDGVPMLKRNDEEIRVLTPEQIEQLIEATKKGRHAARDKAILLLLYDTGLRASELCNLLYKDLDLTGRTAYVLGKGNKHRTVDFSLRTARAIYEYLRTIHTVPKREPDDVLFKTGKTEAGELPMNRDSLRHAMLRWQEAAGLKGVRVSPHTIRHSCATEYLRSEGATEKALQQMLGHTDLQMTHKYAKMSRTDRKAEHRRCSPVDRLKLRKQ